MILIYFLKPEVQFQFRKHFMMVVKKYKSLSIQQTPLISVIRKPGKKNLSLLKTIGMRLMLICGKNFIVNIFLAAP